ncbi:MmgE/PrpD family protein [Sphingomonas hengshuiensis]|uniref:MmgE/PrpD n=1 Tax=Sphingomonas hengshuiensis TaxID=1609977 RepID=A0A7U4LFR1_9SPHN|nr:MmgE/PrpD family protein [Sphingomonas hengshuiensis]AJP72777.1 MmgE/PrpD [Sphingomonas hengshuiensis]
MSATRRLLDFARAEHRLPDAVRGAALAMLADTLATGAAGAQAPGAEGVRNLAAGWGAGEDARLLGDAARMPAASAAFVNGFRIHCLEWDALHERAVVHGFATVVAALMAAIDRRGECDPDEALAALAVGIDVASGLGIAATSPLRFFRPATAGCIGAALAVARIERVERFDDVLGLAYSQCAGTMQAHVEGSIALPLQIAGAARAAVTAVDMVRHGLSGPHDALEGPFGYFRLIDTGALATYTDTIGSVWRIAECSIKPYPSGRASHGLLAALDGLLRAGEVRAERVAAVELVAPPLIARLVGRPMQPDMTPGYARLCLPFLTALMLADGVIDPRRFTAETFADPAIVALAARFTLTTDTNPDPNALSPQRLIVRRADGSAIERAIPNTLGHPDAPMDAAQTAAKRTLAAQLAPDDADPRLFADSLSYLTRPEPR